MSVKVQPDLLYSSGIGNLSQVLEAGEGGEEKALHPHDVTDRSDNPLT